MPTVHWGCVSFLFLYRQLPPGGNPNAVNKYTVL